MVVLISKSQCWFTVKGLEANSVKRSQKTMQGYFSSPAKLMVNYFAISLNRVICATAAAIVSSFNSVIPQTGYNE